MIPLKPHSIKAFLTVIVLALLYGGWLFLQYSQKTSLPDRFDANLTVERVDAAYDLNRSSYAYTPHAWGLKPTKKSKKIKTIKIGQEEVVPLTIDTHSKPMKFCLGESCYEIYGYTDQKVLLYEDDPDEGGFVTLAPGQRLMARIRFDGFEKSTIKFYDEKMDRPFSFTFFDVNVTKYLPKAESQSNGERQ